MTSHLSSACLLMQQKGTAHDLQCVQGKCECMAADAPPYGKEDEPKYFQGREMPAELCRAVDGLMKDLPLKKLRNFGGKLGAELAEMQCTTAGQVAALPHKALVARFGEERATFIARAVRGYSDEPVQVSVCFCLVSVLAGLMGLFGWHRRKTDCQSWEY